VRVLTIKTFDPLNSKVSTRSRFARLPEKTTPKGDDRAKNPHTHYCKSQKRF